MNKVIVLFDDTLHYIEYLDVSIKCVNRFQFKEAVDILLTDKQSNLFFGDDTEREFEVSNHRIDKFNKYMNNNIWNKL